MNKRDQEILEEAYRKMHELQWQSEHSRNMARILEISDLKSWINVNTGDGRIGTIFTVAELREHLLKVLRERADAAEIELEKMEFPSKS